MFVQFFVNEWNWKRHCVERADIVLLSGPVPNSACAKLLHA